MNNKAQQRFDRSILEAVQATRDADAAKPRRDVTPERTAADRRMPKGRLFLCPDTGATVWDPAATS